MFSKCSGGKVDVNSRANRTFSPLDVARPLSDLAAGVRPSNLRLQTIRQSCHSKSGAELRLSDGRHLQEA